MAVIRERREFFTKPIGVARTDAGAAQVGQSIARSAQRISQLAYDEAAKRAEKVGQETALSIGTDKIFSIDPETNNPIAYKPPQGFGGIAAEAYQDMITKRFESSVDQALKNRAAEVSASVSSSQEYFDTMTDFVGQMYNADEDQTMFSRYIKETGEQYVASTFATMRKKEQEAARKQLIRDSKLNLFLGKADLRKKVALGITGQDFDELLLSLQMGNQNLWDSGSMSVSEYTKNLEEFNAIQSLQGNSRLFSIYGSKSQRERSQIELAIQNPKYMATLPQETRDLIGQAKMSTGVPTLLSALKSYNETAENYVESAADEAFADLNPNISASTSYSDLQFELDKIEDPNIRADVASEATAVWIERSLDATVTNPDQIDKIANELKTSGEVDFNAIKRITQSDDIATALQSLDPSQRADLAKAIEDRRSNLQRIQAGEDQKLEQSFRNQGRNLAGRTDIVREYNYLRTKILNSNLKNKHTILTATDEFFAQQARLRASSLNLSTSQMENVRDAVNLGNPSGLSDGEKKAYDLFRASYVINSSAARGQMDSVIRAKQNQTTKDVNALRFASINDAVANGIYPSAPDLKEYDENNLAGMVLTMRNFDGFPHVMEGLQKGVIMPSLQRAMESSVSSFNEDDLNGTLQVFNLLTESEATTIDGTTQRVDLLRGKISDNAYAMLSAAKTIGRMDGINPLAALLELRTYDGNVEADIKADLEYNGSFNGILAEYPMSDVYRNEVLNVIKMRKVRGGVVNKDMIESIISDYSKGMIVDNNVVAPRIGDKTIYAPANFGLDVNDIVRNRINLIDSLSEAAENSLLANDTPVAAMGNQVIDALGRSALSNLFLSIGANVELFTQGYDKNVEMIRRDRIAAGLEELNFDVKYKPIYQSFREGTPTWEVGYVTETGHYNRIEIDGQPFLLQANVEDFSSKNIRNQRYNQLISLKNNNAPEAEFADANLKYDASLAHMEPSYFISNTEMVSDYAKRLGVSEDEVIDRFNEYRYEYLVGSSEEITEGR